jgi:uncharacterized protein (DUF2267 family)
MDELIKQVAAKTGIGEDKARTAVETVVNFLKAKLPAPIAAHLDTALGAAGSALGNVDLGSVAQAAQSIPGLGGLLGKK